MPTVEPFFPISVFAPDGAVGALRVFISPARYIQGPGVLAHVGRYLSLLRARHAAILISAGGARRHSQALAASLAAAGIAATQRTFGGECSLAEIEGHVAALADAGADCLLAVGGGKCVDAGKAVAFRLDVPVAIVPTLASNDAPCSAVSVLYTPAGVSSGVEQYPCNPALVVVDTAIVAAAPERFLVSGMGDAMATWYEAAVCLHNPQAMTTLGARPTIASAAIGEACAATLFAEGRAAAAAVAAHVVDASLEAVVEANTLLSGLGFESGGLAAAHAFAQSFTMLPRTNAEFLHGEMVAMGTLAQLLLESRPEEARRVARFFATVGLPVHLGQLGIDAGDSDALATVSEGAAFFPFIGNMPRAVDAAALRAALLAADELGRSVGAEVGDDAYRRLHGAG
ncbi:MAG: glycerol dehydrogenase [Polyangiaceae bacterium UTPRO1]|jgi:glycerol dehydrogenase|nr:glycerol dehydrogenase [Myxococcales bacterium]OQY65096.1 MAG: glycerol dehydrogenase [Polyangiaceae bacterium UTPRO1]